jgi:hypothetical protein
MKVRWTDGRLRVRISPSELATLGRGGELVEQLASGSWSLALIVGEATGIDLGSGRVVVCVDRRDIEALEHPTREGIYFRRGDLMYYIEKDYPCAHPRPAGAGEPEAETFPAPEAFYERHRR